MRKLIQITSLSKSFGDQTVLDNIDFNLDKGEIVGLIGPSGSGKSTLIKTMLGMEKADKGEALVLDNKIFLILDIWHKAMLFMKCLLAMKI